MTDWETRYYEAEALHTESNGMLAAERDSYKRELVEARAELRAVREMYAKEASVFSEERSVANGACERAEAHAQHAKELILENGELRAYAELLRSALQSLEQAYSNKHSPQHREACLNEARAALAKNPMPGSSNGRTPTNPVGNAGSTPAPRSTECVHETCQHERLRFGSGGYYVFCQDCPQSWVARKLVPKNDADIGYESAQVTSRTERCVLQSCTKREGD